MAYPEEGKLYTVTNVGSGYNLNQIGGFTSNGTNVTLWAPDTSDSEQWWKMEGDKLYPYKCQNGSKKVCLDRYITRDANYNNADLWEDNDDTQQTIILGVDGTGDQFTIQLLNAKADDGSALYLTGASNPNGGNNPSKVPGAAGNVYWSTIPNYQAPSNYQLWRFTPVNQNPGTGGETYQKLVMPYTLNRLNASFLNEQYTQERPIPHYGADILGGPVGNAEEDIYGSGVGEVVAIEKFTNLGDVLAVRYKDVLLPNGGKTSSLIFRYCHLAEIYVGIGDPVFQAKKIAKRGNSGNGAKFNHLHLEVDNDPPTGAASDPMYTPSDGDGLKKADAIAKMTDPMKVFFLRRDQSFEMVPNNSYVDFTPTPPYIDEV